MCACMQAQVRAADMELVFEADRMYLHGARGAFGAVPLSVTGDMDMNPEEGTYRWVKKRCGLSDMSEMRAPVE